MIKKITSILFSLFISLMLLAQLSIPHHHHEDNVCVNITHEFHHEACEDTHDHANDCSHESEPVHTEDFCYLSELNVFSPDTRKEELKPIITEVLFATHCIMQLHSLEEALELNLKHYPPPNDSLHCQNVVSSSGLRAPPTC